MSKLEKLKRVPLKEEYVVLTGDFRAALILQQFIYWSERVKDFDDFISEENIRLQENEKEPIELLNGWIYKTASELAEECMLVTRKKITGKEEYKTELAKDATILSYIDFLLENGWLSRRNNPNHKWDRKFQYRVDILKLTYDLMELGYPFSDYKLPLDIDKSQFQKLKMQSPEIENASSKIENASSKIENRDSKIENRDSKIENRNTENLRAIAESTLKSTIESTNIHTQQNQKSVCENSLQNLKNEIEKVLGESMGVSALKNLLKIENGIEKVNHYLSIWDNYKLHVQEGSTQVAYFVFCIKNNVPVPPLKVKRDTYSNNGSIPKRNNFKQRNYSDDELESFYCNVIE